MQTPETSLLRLPRQRGLAAIRWKPLLKFWFALFVAYAWLGGSTITAEQQHTMSLDTISQAWNWDFVAWEIATIDHKLKAQVQGPIQGLDEQQRADLARTYLSQAYEIGYVEWQLDQLYAQGVDRAKPPAAALPAATQTGSNAGANAGSAAAAAEAALAAQRRQLEARLEVLRGGQALIRPAVEQAIEAQVGAVLAQEQLGALFKPFPPVWFTFTEPPRKLVASPRDRIVTEYYAMLQPQLPAAERELIEDSFFEEHDLSAYVTYIGGLGAYPTIVVDQAPLPWVLSTVAHEWIHNYLTLYPLGFNYNGSPELTILNETVAEIAGDELGALVLQRFYPELVREFPGKDQPAPLPQHRDQPEPFDYRKEMRHTREVVDMFLAAGRVEDAEEYMEIRRLLFEENGYHIRKLNQAYFAFHGSYGTGAAATSPIGPKLEHLRALSPDLRTFLETVRWFTSEADLDEALARLEPN